MSTFNWVSRIDGKLRKGKLDQDEWLGLTVKEVRQKMDDVLPEVQRDRRRFIHCGKLLNDDKKTLQQYGIKKGSTLHILKTPDSCSPMLLEPRELSEDEMKQFFIALGMAIRNPQFIGVIKRLTENKENLDNLAAACPGLAQDPMAMAILSKPEMLLLLFSPVQRTAGGKNPFNESIKKLAKEHPALLQAMENMMAAVHEEKPSAHGSTASAAENVPAPFSYHLDEMSDIDEDDEDEEMMDTSLQRNRSFSAITPDQLAAAIAAAQQNAGGGGGGAGASSSRGLFGMTGMAPASGNAMGASTSSSASSSSRPTPSSPAITSDMFRAAIEQAMAATSGGASASASGMTSRQHSTQEDDLMKKNLQQMTEMGIKDEALARKALTVMGGDLQAAIDLIFSGWLGDDESAN